MTSSMKKIGFFLITILFNCYVFGQISVSNTQTPAQLVKNVLLGAGVSVSNIIVNGTSLNSQSVNQQIGYFSKNSANFPFSDGVVISSGKVSAIPGISSNFISGAFTANTYSDPDLVTIAGGSINDAFVLEFDFKAAGDSLSFSYMFGSEEYPNFVNSFNDVFGFFISGPGFTGPYANGAQNIAVLPGGSTSVTINNVNNGKSNNGPCVNCSYYVDNSNDVYGPSVSFNGLTTVLTALGKLQCGASYHIKLAIADAGDNVYDSGVFLKSGSFSANTVNFDVKGAIVGNTLSDTLMAEGCSKTSLVFVRPQSQTNVSQVYHVTSTGTLDPHTDLVGFVDSVVFNIGVDSVLYTLDPINDGITEPMEWLEIKGYSVNVCGDTIYDSLTIYVLDKYLLNFDLVDTVKTGCTNINPSLLVTNLKNSIAPFSYSWSNSSTSNPTTFTNTGINNDSTYFFVNVKDGCNNLFKDSVLIINEFKPTLFYPSPNDTLFNFCPSTILPASVIMASNPYPPYTYSWSTGSSSSTANLSNNGADGSKIMYYATITNACGVSTKDSILVINKFEGPKATFVPNDTLTIHCLLDSTLATVSVTNGTLPYTYLWSNNSTSTSTYFKDNLGQNGHVYPFFVKVVDGCGFKDSISGKIIVNKTLNATLSSTITNFCLPDGSAHAVVTGAFGNQLDTWKGPGSSSTSTFNGLDYMNLAKGWYYFTVKDNYCTDTDSVFVDKKLEPIAGVSGFPVFSTPPSTITFTNLSSNASSYEWNFGNGLTLNTTSNSIQYSEYTVPGFYAISVKANEGPCFDTDTMVIEIIDKPIILNEPNVFSPNNDGENDDFFITTKNVKSLNLIINNRWGNLVFEQTAENPKWNGADCVDGVYFYQYSATGLNGDVLKGKGFVHLVNKK